MDVGHAELFVGTTAPLVVTRVVLDGRGDVLAIVDTGAARTALTPAVAAELGLEPARQDTITGAGGTLSVGVATLGSVAVGGAVQSDVEASIVEFGAIATATGYDVECVLGMNWLQHYVVTLDYQGNTIRFSGEPVTRDGAIPFSLAPEKPLIMVSATVNDLPAVPFGVDTGATVSMLAPRVADRAGLTERTEALAVGGGGGAAAEIVTGVTIRVGHAELPDATVAVSPLMDAVAERAGTAVEGLIGQDLLSQYTVTFDFLSDGLFLA